VLIIQTEHENQEKLRYISYRIKNLCDECHGDFRSKFRWIELGKAYKTDKKSLDFDFYAVLEIKKTGGKDLNLAKNIVMEHTGLKNLLL